ASNRFASLSLNVQQLRRPELALARSSSSGPWPAAPPRTAGHQPSPHGRPTHYSILAAHLPAGLVLPNSAIWSSQASSAGRRRRNFEFRNNFISFKHLERRPAALPGRLAGTKFLL